jgi:hypothetical protein
MDKNEREDDLEFDNSQKALNGMVYGVEQNPPWYLSVLLGLQVLINMYIYYSLKHYDVNKASVMLKEIKISSSCSIRVYRYRTL